MRRRFAAIDVAVKNQDNREHDILVLTETGNRNITGFPYGPEHLILR